MYNFCIIYVLCCLRWCLQCCCKQDFQCTCTSPYMHTTLNSIQLDLLTCKMRLLPLYLLILVFNSSNKSSNKLLYHRFVAFTSSSLILHSHLLHPTLPFPQCLSFCLGNQPAKSWKGNAVQICYSNMRGWVHWGFDYYDTSHCVMDAEWHLPYVMFKVYLVPGCWLNILANLLLISIACSPH